MSQYQPTIWQAPSEANEENANHPRSWCTFRLGEVLYGVEIGAVKEVNALPPLTRIPHAPEFVSGYVNLRGQILLVLDLKQMLGLGPCSINPSTRLVVFQSYLGDPFGVLVDQIGDIVQLTPNQIETQHFVVEQTASSSLSCGVGKLEGKLLLIIDARKLLPIIADATR